MSIRVMTWVWDNGPEDRGELLVMLALADFADDHGRCYPSMRRIAEKARMTERGAQKIVQRLIEDGYLEVRQGGGRGGCNNYRLLKKQVGAQGEEGEKGRTAFGESGSGGEPGDKKPRTGEQKTPNGGSPEPSGTVKLTAKEKDAQQVRALLCSVLSEEVADDWIDHRKAKGATMTVRAAEIMVRRLKHLTREQADAAAHYSIAQGYRGMFPDPTPSNIITLQPKRTGNAWTEGFLSAIDDLRMADGPGDDPLVPLLPARH